MQYTKASTREDEDIPTGMNIAHSKTCVVCGDGFRGYSNRGKYCSQRCKNDAFITWRRNNTASKRARAKVCTICAAPLTQDSPKIKAYCSNACKQKAYRVRKLQFIH